VIAVYVPVLSMVGVAVLLAVSIFAITSMAGPRRMTAEKAIPYESGSETDGAKHVRLSVKFYLTAILFVVFDVEAVFLYPWAALFRRLGAFGLLEMLSFLAVLALTLLYAFRKGAFEWAK